MKDFLQAMIFVVLFFAAHIVAAQEIDMNKVKEFAMGQSDCRSGIEPKKPATKAYLQGYGFQYSVEQVANHRSVNNENIK